MASVATICPSVSRPESTRCASYTRMPAYMAWLRNCAPAWCTVSSSQMRRPASTSRVWSCSQRVRAWRSAPQALSVWMPPSICISRRLASAPTRNFSWSSRVRRGRKKNVHAAYSVVPPRKMPNTVAS